MQGIRSFDKLGCSFVIFIIVIEILLFSGSGTYIIDFRLYVVVFFLVRLVILFIYQRGGLSGSGGYDFRLYCSFLGMDELMEVFFLFLAVIGKLFFRCGKCYRFMKYIQVGEGIKGCDRFFWFVVFRVQMWVSFVICRFLFYF